jgi:cell division protein FtsZ
MICNTDKQALEKSPIPYKTQLGPQLTEGLGAGSTPEKGKQACIESLEEVKEKLSDGYKMIFIAAGMGGGTGTGAAPIIAKISKELGLLTVGIVTTPFNFEGKKRVTQGFDGIDDLRKNVDTLIVVSNDKLRDIHGNMGISDAFKQADNILATAAKGISEIITVPGYVNVDFADVDRVMRNSGVAIMGIASAEGEHRASIAIDEALNSPLLEENNIAGAKNILVNISLLSQASYKKKRAMRT